MEVIELFWDNPRIIINELVVINQYGLRPFASNHASNRCLYLCLRWQICVQGISMQIWLEEILQVKNREGVLVESCTVLFIQDDVCFKSPRVVIGYVVAITSC